MPDDGDQGAPCRLAGAPTPLQTVLLEVIPVCDLILIDGAPFFAVAHHDARFLRTSGLAALARRDADGGYTVLHLEHCEAINREMAPTHARWGWALAQGLDTLLVQAAKPKAMTEGDTTAAAALPIRWHAEAAARTSIAGD